MESKYIFKKLTPILVALVLIVSSILMLIPATRDGILSVFGLAEEKPVYNGFEPFVPFVPGYFPDDFDITKVGNYQTISEELSVYSEIYATDTLFFKIIQTQGRATPHFIPDARFTIQGAPVSLTEIRPEDWLREKELDGTVFDLTQGWLVSLILKDIHIQIVTNLPREEALLVAEGLVPAICTTKPTPTPGD
jgi:hypothetical protein